MNITVWSIIYILGSILCLSGTFVFTKKKGAPPTAYYSYYAITALHIWGFLWHSFGDRIRTDHFPNALLLFDIFSMACLAGAALFLYFTIASQHHKVLKPDAAGSIAELDMDSVESAENCYVFKCGKLYIIFPRYREIKFVFPVCPSMKDKDLTFFATATFFKELSFAYYISSAVSKKADPRFHQLSVVGCHAQDGVVYEGADRGDNALNAFTFYNGEAHFIRENPDDAIKLAAENGGDGFESYMAIWEGQKLGSLVKKKRCFRILAELNGRVCIIESSVPVSYDVFIQSAMDIGIQKALYLDIGAKSSYSQYRDNQNHAVNLFSRHKIYFSGWIAFYK